MDSSSKAHVVAMLLVVLVSACAEPESVAPAPSSSMSEPTPSPSAWTEAEDVFASLEGFEFVDLPERVEEQQRRSIEGDPTIGKALLDWGSKSVLEKAGDPLRNVATVLVIDEREASFGDFRDDVVRGMTKQAGEEPKILDIEGEVAYVFPVDARLKAIAFFWDTNVFILLLGERTNQLAGVAAEFLSTRRN